MEGFASQKTSSLKNIKLEEFQSYKSVVGGQMGRVKKDSK